ncbi:uncharacterized protein LOC108739914 [Agrilus planipennis]|uniref:Uncharacterized protein LOC108739914 n=1 Tax=Agrilus planipennis TaxID=224129 RepID=A0A1W4XB26_AGRPL|nr:uncharacterized protein LOC108739914 [Agrilus planipennis]
MSRPQNADPPSSVDRLAVKLPPFVPSDPEALRPPKLPRNPQNSTEVLDIIINPPATEPHVTIKVALVRQLGISQEARTKQLLGHEEIGDRKLSQFLRHLRSLVGKIWSGRLPQSLHTVIATMKDKQLDGVAEIADYIMKASQKQSVISASITPTLQYDIIQQLTNKFNSNDRTSGLCYYHRKFQDKARKCIPPCRKSSGNQPGAH